MKKIMLAICCVISFSGVTAQTIIKILLIGDKGPTNEKKEAKSFIAVKKYPDGSIQLLDYKMQGPLKKVTTYTDIGLRVLEGPYYEYEVNGAVKLSGTYSNNRKDREWYYFNDTGKVILTEKYMEGELMETINPDTVKKNNQTESDVKSAEREAGFPGKTGAWKNYLIKALNPDIALKSTNGGVVRVGFAIDVSGRPVDIYIRKSVEYVLDEEALRVIYNMPDWNPAIRNGMNVKAYRVQPFSFIKE
ncbi:MAG: TonB family protein [Chitinophagaceae bacterium]|nr:TonB family protein [Chitinophagaceae bacterium]